MGSRTGVLIAAALIALAQGCSDDGPPFGGAGTCTPSGDTTPDPDGAAAFCAEFGMTVCERGFGECAAEIDYPASYFSSVEECASYFAYAWCGAVGVGSWYDAACGAACISYLRYGPCRLFTTATAPQACEVATGAGDLTLVPPCSQTIGPGTISDTITAADPTYVAGHARSYCVSFAAGEQVLIETSAPLSGAPIVDTVLYLVDAAGTVLASNDDTSGYYSRIALTIPATGPYRVVVRGYSPADVGSYRLTVASQ